MVNKAISFLAEYAVSNGLIDAEDSTFAVNGILEAVGLDAFQTPEDIYPVTELEQALKILLDDAVARGVIEDGPVRRDLLDTKIMGALTPRPSEVRRTFRKLYAESPEKATDWYYQFSQATNYIRSARVARDIHWKAATEYGDIDISINLSKPEKDPKAIAAAKLLPQSGYPKCMLCAENAGYAGRLDFPARQNHRIIPVSVNGQSWYLQYSPYVYYNEHCIVFNGRHTPMKIDGDTCKKLLSFVEHFPHYFVGSNADLPIVGGSILSHDHFQGGRYTFAMEKAPVETPFTFAGYEDITAGIVKWPMSVIRLAGADTARLCELAEIILKSWRGYTDESAFVFAVTENQPHNTITPIARCRDGVYELDLVLRNNITTQEHPLGVYHPHAEKHHIKKENIGLIEVMGLAILPARLKAEMRRLEELILTGGDFTADPLTASHAEWAKDILSRRPINAGNVRAVLKEEIGIVFSQVLEDAGVYKRTAEGKEAFLRFLNAVNAR